MDEHTIEQATKGLGSRAGARLDVERVTASVLERLRADRAAAARPWRVRWTAPLVLRLAAALAVLATGGVLVRGLWENGAETSLVAPILRDLSTEELTEVFDSLSAEAPVHEGVAIGLENLSEAQLRELLRLMEG